MLEIEEYELLPDPREIEGFAPDDEVYIQVVIGNGQVGSTVVKIGDEALLKGAPKEPHYLGLAEDLANQDMNYLTNVLDINPSTNRCIVSTTFSNQNYETMRSDVDKGKAPEGGVASFSGRYLIKLITVLVFFILTFSNSLVYGQDFSFDDLETPTSPGLILFDKTPSSIERPTTPQGLGISVLTLYQESGGAIDFAPFWLVDHPKLTAEKLYSRRIPILSNFTVSGASIASDTSQSLSFGIRTRLLQVYSEETRKRIPQILKKLEELLIDPIENADEIVKLRDELTDEHLKKPIWTLDAAYAMGGTSVDKSFEGLQANIWAAWLNLSYRPGGNDFYGSLLGRYYGGDNEANMSSSQWIDVGLRFNYDFKPVTLSLEYLERFLDDDSTNRLAIVGNYEFVDNLFITATFGKNFGLENNILAVAGINIGFSKNKLSAIGSD